MFSLPLKVFFFVVFNVFITLLFYIVLINMHATYLNAIFVLLFVLLLSFTIFSKPTIVFYLKIVAKVASHHNITMFFFFL